MDLGAFMLLWGMGPQLGAPAFGAGRAVAKRRRERREEFRDSHQQTRPSSRALQSKGIKVRLRTRAAIDAGLQCAQPLDDFRPGERVAEKHFLHRSVVVLQRREPIYGRHQSKSPGHSRFVFCPARREEHLLMLDDPRPEVIARERTRGACVVCQCCKIRVVAREARGRPWFHRGVLRRAGSSPSPRTCARSTALSGARPHR